MKSLFEKESELTNTPKSKLKNEQLSPAAKCGSKYMLYIWISTIVAGVHHGVIERADVY